MVTETHNRIGKDDNRILWTIAAIIVIAILAYAAYASYHNNTPYEARSRTSATGSAMTGSGANTTGNMGTTAPGTGTANGTNNMDAPTGTAPNQ